jgi:ubiquinone/menaquinone biosynthesis C-methylase UbiE
MGVMTNRNGPRRTPDRNAALEQYRRRALLYDLELAVFEPIRRRAIGLLALKRGETVLDVGCGTGLSLELLRQGVGARGSIIGIEQSPEMIDQARHRVESHRWKNVALLNSPVEAVEIPAMADAALFHFTHDILLRSDAIANVARHLKPGARVVACGLKLAEPWAWPVNLLVLPAAMYSVTSLAGLRKPWSRLARWLDPLSVETTMLGGVYIAAGERVRDT